MLKHSKQSLRLLKYMRAHFDLLLFCLFEIERIFARQLETTDVTFRLATIIVCCVQWNFSCFIFVLTKAIYAVLLYIPQLQYESEYIYQNWAKQC